ncbi:unnamed protein product [Schistocephalus solidus]|uniref:Dirigent protein n=1 Tax=Schistocephalus solidus TaxID=70667 RepID=A0A183STC7_SCHSO|nr:unnamed protein product [Schistocephalus solidus]
MSVAQATDVCASNVSKVCRATPGLVFSDMGPSAGLGWVRFRLNRAPVSGCLGARKLQCRPSPWTGALRASMAYNRTPEGGRLIYNSLCVCVFQPEADYFVVSDVVFQA